MCLIPFPENLKPTFLVSRLKKWQIPRPEKALLGPFMQWYSRVPMTSFFSYWYSRVPLVFKEFMHRYCRVHRIHSMSRPLSNIASLNIFDSVFHFFTSRANRGATVFHFQFDSAFHLGGKVPGKVPVRMIPTRLPVESSLLRLDKHVIVQPLKKYDITYDILWIINRLLDTVSINMGEISSSSFYFVSPNNLFIIQNISYVISYFLSG